jgi:hypothetical protein
MALNAYDECLLWRVSFTVSVTVKFIMLNGIMMNVIMLNVMAPFEYGIIIQVASNKSCLLLKIILQNTQTLQLN